jgi:hypothetical protein
MVSGQVRRCRPEQGIIIEHEVASLVVGFFAYLCVSCLFAFLSV